MKFSTTSSVSVLQAINFTELLLIQESIQRLSLRSSQRYLEIQMRLKQKISNLIKAISMLAVLS